MDIWLMLTKCTTEEDPLLMILVWTDWIKHFIKEAVNNRVREKWTLLELQTSWAASDNKLNK